MAPRNPENTGFLCYNWLLIGLIFHCRSRKDMDERQIKYHEHEVTNVVEVITNMSNPFEVEDSMVNIASGRWLLQMFRMT